MERRPVPDADLTEMEETIAALRDRGEDVSITADRALDLIAALREARAIVKRVQAAPRSRNDLTVFFLDGALRHDLAIAAKAAR